MAQFKVLTYIQSIKDSKKDVQPYEFEKFVNQRLQKGWKIINCDKIYLGGVSPTNGMHYWPYVVKN